VWRSFAEATREYSLRYPLMIPDWKTYPPVYLYYLKRTGKGKRAKTLIDFLIMKTKN